MAVGRYYQRKGRYVGAANRFRTVVEQYQTTTHIEEALHRLTEVYLALGVRDEAVKSAAVLGHNYPSSEWYQDSYALLANDQTLPAPVPGGPRKRSPAGGGVGDDTLIEPPADAQDGPV